MDVNSGKALWTFKTGSEVKSSPVVVGDRVLIGSYDDDVLLGQVDLLPQLERRHAQRLVQLVNRRLAELGQRAGRAC